MRLCFLLAALSLSGCATAPSILERTSYWPFERIKVQTRAVGALTLYAHRAEQATRVVVIVQSPPCSTDASLFSTGGLLWEELKGDSLLLQLERPGRLRNQPATEPDCRPALRENITAEVWASALREVLPVFEAPALPVIYIGIGPGAVPATQLAAANSRAALLLLVNASGLNPGFETVLADVHAEPSRPVQELLIAPLAPSPRTVRPATNMPATSGVPTVLVQSGDANAASALLWYSQLAARGSNPALLVVQAQGTDFGLSAGNPECFEQIMQLIATRTRDLSRPHAATLTSATCSPPAAEQ